MLMELLLFVIAKTDATAVGATSTLCWSSGEHRGDLITGYWNWLLATGAAGSRPLWMWALLAGRLWSTGRRGCAVAGVRRVWYVC